MKPPIVIFGAGDLGELAHFYLRTDSPYEVVAFTLDRAYIQSPTFGGLPLVPFEDITTHYPPGEHAMFIALSYSKLNAVRKEKFEAARALGYALPGYVSSRASLLNEGRIGANCFILEDNTVQPFVTIGDNVTLWSGNHIGHHSTIGDHTFLASHVVVSGGVRIGQQCFVGVNATLRDHITVGDRCVLGAGTLLLEDAEPEGVYMGTGTERSRVPSTRLRGI
mgnify:CR=1 FL=1